METNSLNADKLSKQTKVEREGKQGDVFFHPTVYCQYIRKIPRELHDLLSRIYFISGHNLNNILYDIVLMVKKTERTLRKDKSKKKKKRDSEL